MFCTLQSFQVNFARGSSGRRIKRSMTQKISGQKFCAQKNPTEILCAKKIRSDILGWKCVTDRSLMCCYALFIFASHWTTIATTTRNAFYAAQLCPNNNWPIYQEAHVRFSSFTQHASCLKVSNLLNGIARKCMMKKITPNANHRLSPWQVRRALMKAVTKHFAPGGTISRENHFEVYCSILEPPQWAP